MIDAIATGVTGFLMLIIIVAALAMIVMAIINWGNSE